MICTLCVCMYRCVHVCASMFVCVCITCARVNIQVHARAMCFLRTCERVHTCTYACGYFLYKNGMHMCMQVCNAVQIVCCMLCIGASRVLEDMGGAARRWEAGRRSDTDRQRRPLLPRLSMSAPHLRRWSEETWGLWGKESDGAIMRVCARTGARIRASVQRRVKISDRTLRSTALTTLTIHEVLIIASHPSALAMQSLGSLYGTCRALATLLLATRCEGGRGREDERRGRYVMPPSYGCPLGHQICLGRGARGGVQSFTQSFTQRLPSYAKAPRSQNSSRKAQP